MNRVQQFLNRLNDDPHPELDEGFVFTSDGIGCLAVKHNCGKSDFCTELYDDKEVEYKCEKCTNGSGAYIATLPVSRLSILHSEYQQVCIANMMDIIDQRLKDIEKVVFTSKEARAMELCLEANAEVENLKSD